MKHCKILNQDNEKNYKIRKVKEVGIQKNSEKPEKA